MKKNIAVLKGDGIGPEIVEQANLKETSLYHLAMECGIDDPEAFTRRFIAEDQEVRAR